MAALPFSVQFEAQDGCAQDGWPLEFHPSVLNLVSETHFVYKYHHHMQCVYSTPIIVSTIQAILPVSSGSVLWSLWKESEHQPLIDVTLS